MTEANNIVTANCRLIMHYSLTLEDGTEVVSTFNDTPLSFCLGDGTMVETLEQSLIGLTCGADVQILVSGDDAFGSKTDAKIQRIPRNEFSNDLTIESGQVIAFTTPGGDEVAGQLLEINPDDVVVDFNHPLSGHMISFRAKILAIEPTTQSTSEHN